MVCVSIHVAPYRNRATGRRRAFEADADLEHRNVVRRTGADECGLIVASVDQFGCSRRCPLDDMEIGDDMTRFVPDEA